MNDTYLQPYHDAAEQYGDDMRVTLWASPRSQRLRFAVMTQLVDFTDKTVLDAGCSRGDFAAYLLEHGIEYGRFVGVDGVPEVIEQATAAGLARAEFLAGDFVKQPELLGTGRPDVVTISGSLNTMDWPTARGVLEGAWAGAGESLVFNFLSDRPGKKAPPQEDPAKRLPTLTALDWALEKTPNVVLRQDYFRHGHDATILMSKHVAGE